MYNFSGHKSVHRYSTSARYVLEVRKEVYFENGKMVDIVWPEHPNYRPHDPAWQVDWDSYHNQHTFLQDKENEWEDNLERLLEEFKSHHTQIKSPFKVTGITRQKSISKTGPQKWAYNAPVELRPIQTYNFFFGSEEARQAFLDWLDKKGYIDAAILFFEMPKGGKKGWTPIP